MTPSKEALWNIAVHRPKIDWPHDSTQQLLRRLKMLDGIVARISQSG